MHAATSFAMADLDALYAAAPRLMPVG